LMQKKLNKLGAHYHQMFIMSDLHVTNTSPPATIVEPTSAIAKASIEVVELE